MNLAVMKSKAEAALTEQFDAAVETLPGSAAVQGARREAFDRFSSLGLPHRRVEEWKYTDLKSLWKDPRPPAVATGKKAAVSLRDVEAALGSGLAGIDGPRLVFIDGRFAEALSRFDGGRGKSYHCDALSDAIASGNHEWLNERLQREGDLLPGAILALNTAFMSDGVILRVEADADIAGPIQFVFVNSGGDGAGRVTTRNFVRVGSKAKVTFIETHIGIGAGDTDVNTALDLHIEDGADARHIKVVTGNGGGLHLGTMQVVLGGDTNLRAFQYTANTGLARNDVTITYAGENTAIDLSGVFLARANQHIDTTFVIDHAVPHCVSRELFKGVLDNQARGVFQGKVIVRPDAQKTDGKQMAQALMLSPDCEFDSKPELEIYADDVVCGHGTTSAEIDDDLLFYCMSRGIPEEEARALLIDSFIGEAIDKVEHDGARAALMAAASGWLRQAS